MRQENQAGSDGRLSKLREREAALKTAIAIERVRLERRREKEQARLAGIVGRCVLADLKANPQIGLAVEESLKRHADPRDAEFLRARGWRV